MDKRRTQNKGDEQGGEKADAKNKERNKKKRAKEEKDLKVKNKDSFSHPEQGHASSVFRQAERDRSCFRADKKQAKCIIYIYLCLRPARSLSWHAARLGLWLQDEDVTPRRLGGDGARGGERDQVQSLLA